MEITRTSTTLTIPETNAAATPSATPICCPFTALINDAKENEIPCWRS